MKSFGAILKHLREERELTQQELAEKSKLSRVQIARLESNSRKPLWSQVAALSVALGVSTEIFLVTPDESKKPTKAKKGKNTDGGRPDSPNK
jgi:transcriptional regulator with XRE-family HTH domain